MPSLLDLVRRFATWVGSSARSLLGLIFRYVTARPSQYCLLGVPREIRNNIFAYHIANSQDDPSTMLMINRQLAAEYMEAVAFHHSRHMPQIVADLRTRFPQLEFDIILPPIRTKICTKWREIRTKWCEITTLTLSLPVSQRNVRNPIFLGFFLVEVLKLRMSPYTDTVKIVSQPPQRMPAP